PSYVETQIEGWFIQRYLDMAFTDLVPTADLPATSPAFNDGTPVRFVSCPPDWACALINRNLIRALGLEDMVEVVEPATRFEMDTLIAEAVSRDVAIVFYYWQPNAVLALFDFAALDMGAFDPEAAKCLAQLA